MNKDISSELNKYKSENPIKYDNAVTHYLEIKTALDGMNKRQKKTKKSYFSKLKCWLNKSSTKWTF